MALFLSIDAISGRVLECSPSFLERMGYSPEEVFDAFFFDFFEPESRDVLQQAFVSSAREEALRASACLLRGKDGAVWPVKLDVWAPLGKAGVSPRLSLTLRDEEKGISPAFEATQHQLTMLDFALNRVGEMILLTDKHGRFHYANDEACALLGYAREELLTMGVEDVDPLRTRENWPERWREIVEKRLMIFERQFKRKNGAVFPVELSTNYFTYAGAEYNLAIVRNITERKLAEEELNQSQHTLEIAEKILDAGAWSLPEPFLTGTFTTQLCAIMEVSEAPSFEDFLSFHVPPEHRERCAERMRQCVEEGVPYDIEIEFITKTGRRFWGRSIAEAEFQDGRVVQVVGAIQDITERKKAENRMRLLDFALDHIAEGVFLIDTEARFHYVNREACKKLGYSREELIGMRVPDVNPVFSMEAWTAHWPVVKKEKRSITLQTQHRTKEGKVFPVEISGNYFEYEGNEYKLSLVEDITEKKQTESRMRILDIALNHVSNMVFLVGTDARFQYVNLAACVKLGYSREELLTMRVADVDPIFTMDHRAAFLEELQKARTMRFESLLRKKDGVIFPMELCSNYFEHEGVAYDLAIAEDITEKKKLESRMRLFDFALDHIAEGVFLIDANACFVYVNLSWCEKLGYVREELIGKRIPDIDPVFTMESWSGHWPAMKEKGSITLQTLHRTKEGKVFPVEAAGSYFEYEDVPYNLCLVQDITERKKAENELRLLAGALDQVEEVVLLNDRNQRFRYANEAACRKLGYSRKELLKMYVTDIVPQHTHAEVVAMFDEIQKGALRDPFETTHTGRDGRVIPIQIQLSAFQYDGTAYCLSFSKDITEKKKAEDELLLLTSALNEVQDVVLLYARSLRFRYVNDAACRHFGYSREELLTMCVIDINPNFSHEEFSLKFDAVQAQGTLELAQTTQRTKDGRLIPVEVRLSAFHYQDTAYCLSVTRDMTEKRSLEKQLRESQKIEAVGLLADGISHDFNNILSAQLLHLDLLQGNGSLDGEARESLEQIGFAANRAALLCRQLLTFSYRSEAEMKTIDLNGALQNLLKLLQRLIWESIDIRFSMEEGVPCVLADPVMLDQVVMNLAINARDAMPTGGRLTISTEVLEIDSEALALHPRGRVGCFIRLGVADTGCGMSAEVLARIFEPFFATKGKGKGSGLGMAATFKIVEGHGGWIEVESAPGKGSTFSVYLPAAAGAGKDVSGAMVTALGPVPGGGERILVVEDEADVRSILVQAFTQLGYRVFAAANGPEALRVWEKEEGKIDLLFSDVVMPGGLNGLQLARKLREKKPDLKVILASGYSKEALDGVNIEKERMLYLCKPFDLQVLAACVREALKGKLPLMKPTLMFTESNS